MPRELPLNGGFGANCRSIAIGFAACSGGFGGGFGFGVSAADRARALATPTRLSAALGTQTTPVTAIKDGTSNTIRF